MTQQNGFSLVELSVVLSIIAVLIGASIILTNKQLLTNQLNHSHDKLEAISEAIQQHLALSGDMPCPAPFNAALSSATFGVSTVCADAAVAGETIDIDNIRIGTVPTRSLNIPDDYMFDAWDMRITYAVVKELATIGSFDGYTIPATSVITINDKYAVAQLDTTNNVDTVAYILISHGKDKAGARNKTGTTTNTCADTNLDDENCGHDDAVFISTPPQTQTTGASYTDDITFWQTYTQINPALKY